MELFIIAFLYVFAIIAFMVIFRQRIHLSGIQFKQKIKAYVIVLLLAITWIISVPLIFLVRKD